MSPPLCTQNSRIEISQPVWLPDYQVEPHPPIPLCLSIGPSTLWSPDGFSARRVVLQGALENFPAWCSLPHNNYRLIKLGLIASNCRVLLKCILRGDPAEWCLTTTTRKHYQSKRLHYAIFFLFTRGNLSDWYLLWKKNTSWAKAIIVHSGLPFCAEILLPSRWRLNTQWGRPLHACYMHLFRDVAEGGMGDSSPLPQTLDVRLFFTRLMGRC